MYKLIENDVRLLRRILVALQLGDGPSAAKIVKYLRGKGLNFKLPEEQSPTERVGYASRLPSNEQWLVETYGCIILPDYSDAIFLNSKWINPYTLYVRLVSEVPELKELGSIYWIPDKLGLEEEFRSEAELAHSRYKARYPYQPKLVVPWINKILGRE
jgi:hypothetical protein